MAKGVKSLKMTDGRYYPGSSRVNKNMVIKADLEAVFEVNEWHSGTTAQEKAKNLTWFWFDENKKLITKDAGQIFRVTIPKRLCGSYTYYLEASLSGNFDMKSGIYIRGLSDLKIKKSKWKKVALAPAIAKQQKAKKLVSFRKGPRFLALDKISSPKGTSPALSNGPAISSCSSKGLLCIHV